MPWSYTPDERDTGEWLRGRRGPEIRDLLYQRARLGLSVAQALAPVSTRRTDPHRGALRASGRVVDNGIGGFRHDRLEFLVEFTVEYSVNDAFRKGYPHARDFLRAALPAIQKG
jgi:hypothetical protein